MGIFRIRCKMKYSWIRHREQFYVQGGTYSLLYRSLHYFLFWKSLDYFDKFSWCKHYFSTFLQIQIVQMARTDCPACLKKLVEPRTLPCGHVYCLGCLEMLQTKKNRVQCHICKGIHTFVLEITDGKKVCVSVIIHFTRPEICPLQPKN